MYTGTNYCKYSNRFARGDVENAEKMCLEIIRQDPTIPEPFQTLATIYEEAEEIEKSLQFALIAAHLGLNIFPSALIQSGQIIMKYGTS